jgi:hypothetical protein
MTKMILMLVGAGGSIAVGGLYVFQAFGPTEAEVATWGIVAIFWGIALIILATASGQRPHVISKFFVSLGYLGLALFQIFPIFLWFQYSGRGISDGTPPSAFVAHWWYAFPHLAVLLVSIGVIFLVWFTPAQTNQ